MAQAAEPSVTVIIPCYKQGAFLAEAIDSVLGQTYPHVQALVVDDGSPDETAEVARRYGDRIRYIRKQNAGVSAARNTGLLACFSDFVVFLDADDYLRPDVLERHMEAARREPEAVVFHGGWQEVDVAGRLLREVNAEPLDNDPFHSLLGGNHFPPVTLVVRRAAFANAGLFDADLPFCEDWDMWIRLAATGGRFVPVPDVFPVYRQHANGKSRNFEGVWLAGLAILLKSRSCHKNCPRCRRMIGWNIRKWRYRCLKRELETYRVRGETLQGVAKAARDTARSPLLAGLLLLEPVYQVRAGLAQLRRSLSRSSPSVL